VRLRCYCQCNVWQCARHLPCDSWQLMRGVQNSLWSVTLSKKYTGCIQSASKLSLGLCRTRFELWHNSERCTELCVTGDNVTKVHCARGGVMCDCTLSFMITVIQDTWISNYVFIIIQTVILTINLGSNKFRFLFSPCFYKNIFKKDIVTYSEAHILHEQSFAGYYMAYFLS
jgi:hypothetical protein